MRLVSVGLALVILSSSQLEARVPKRIIYFPDSLIGSLHPTSVCAAPGLGKAYISGQGGMPAVVAVSGTTETKVARVPLTEDADRLYWNPSCASVYALGRRELTVIDARTDQILPTLTLPDCPGVGVWYEPDSSFYVAHRLYGWLLKIDGLSHQVLCSLSVPITPVHAVALPERHKLFVAGRDDTIAVIDALADSVTRTIPVGNYPVQLAASPDRDLVYCANSLGSSVSVITCHGDSVIATITVGTGPVTLAYDSLHAKLYCACRYANLLAVIDAGTNQVRTTIPISVPQALALDPVRARLFVGSQGNRLTVIETETDSILASLPVGRDIRELAVLPDLGLTLAPSYQDGNALLVRPDLAAKTLPIATSGPRAAIVAGEKLYVAQEQAGTVDVLALPDLNPVRRLGVGAGPNSFCYNHRTAKLYCACEGANHVAVIDVGWDSVVKVIPVGNAPRSIVWDSLDNKVYCGNYGEPVLTVIDCDCDSVVARVEVGRGTRRVVYNPISRKLYLACHDEHEIQVLDCLGDSLLARFPTGGNPWTVGLDALDNVAYGATSWGGPIICGFGDTLLGNIGDVFYVKGACWNPLTNKVYLARNYSNDVLVVDGTSRSVIRRVPVAAYPAEMATTATSHRVYAVHYLSGRLTNLVSVIDDDSLLDAYSVPNSPVNLYVNSDAGEVYVLSWESSCLSVIDDNELGAREEVHPGRTTARLQVWPNPCKGQIRLRVVGPSDWPTTIVVRDPSGRTIESWSITAGKWQGLETDLGPGVYFLGLSGVTPPTKLISLP
ncbi:MAG: YncE family protein [candidate division WOR-3 bacterium]